MDSIDLSFVVESAIKTVPLWSIVLLSLGYWLKKAGEYQKEEKERWDRIEHKIYNLEMAIASSGLSDLKKRIDDIDKAVFKNSLQIEAAWHVLDNSNETSNIKNGKPIRT